MVTLSGMFPPRHCYVGLNFGKHLGTKPVTLEDGYVDGPIRVNAFR